MKFLGTRVEVLCDCVRMRSMLPRVIFFSSGKNGKGNGYESKKQKPERKFWKNCFRTLYGTVCVWDVATRKCVRVFKAVGSSGVQCAVAFGTTYVYFHILQANMPMLPVDVEI